MDEQAAAALVEPELVGADSMPVGALADREQKQNGCAGAALPPGVATFVVDR
jgi:hypothetical protein